MKESEYFIERPEQIKISITNVCNYRCVMCFNPNLKQPRGFMKDGLVYKILDDCHHSGIKNVALGAMGEPLLERKFIDYVKYAKSLGLWISTTTNCSLLMPDLVEQLIEAKLDRIRLSIYSSSPDEHKRYCGNDHFDQVVNNIKYFLKLWYQRQSKMEVNLSFLNLPSINDYSSFEKIWKPITDEVGLVFSMKPPVNWAGQIDIPGVTVIGKKIHLDRTPNGIRLSLFKRVRCMHLRYYLQVLHTGEVLPCCILPDHYGHEEMLLGNLNGTNIMDIWQGEKYKTFKLNHFNKAVSIYPLCSNCSETYRKIDMLLSTRNLAGRVKTFLQLRPRYKQECE